MSNSSNCVLEKAEQAERVSDYIVQSRSAIKGIFGSDSYEYDMVGGTRASERKKPKRKGKPVE